MENRLNFWSNKIRFVHIACKMIETNDIQFKTYEIPALGVKIVKHV